MTETTKTPTGELLKRKREELQLSLNDIHDKTKISLRMLKNIEQGDVPGDVPKVCLKGFIKSYCECVNKFLLKVSFPGWIYKRTHKRLDELMLAAYCQ